MSSGNKIQLRLLICVCLLILWMLATVDQFISFNISFKSPKFWSQNFDKFSDYAKFLAWTRKQSHLRQHMKQTCSKLGLYTKFWSLIIHWKQGDLQYQIQMAKTSFLFLLLIFCYVEMLRYCDEIQATYVELYRN